MPREFFVRASRSAALVALVAHGACNPSRTSAKPAGTAAAGTGATRPADAPLARPFAGSPSEATQLIEVAIEKNAHAVRKCVAEYRTRKHLPHERVEIAVGIDQEGRLLGAALKGNNQDAPLSECVQRALAGSPFPRSHAGIILLTKTYEEIEQ